MTTPADLDALTYLATMVKEYRKCSGSESVFVFMQRTKFPVEGNWCQFATHPFLAKPVEIVARLREDCRDEDTNDFVSSRCGDVMSLETIRVMVTILDIFCSTQGDSVVSVDNLVRVESVKSADNLVRVDSVDSDESVDNFVWVKSV